MRDDSIIQPTRGPQTINEMLEYRARANMLRPLFLDIDGNEQDALTATALLAKARGVAGYLRTRYSAGDRLLIACHQGWGPIVAFFAALEAGCVAVPVPAIDRRQDGCRLASIIEDCQPKAMLLADRKGINGERENVEILDIETATVANSGDWTPVPGLNPSSLALLQYTSGSIGKPKGVKISHANLLSNLRAIEREFALSPDDIAVLWLPLFHDMGLIGGMLQAVFTGYSVYRLSAARVTRNPMCWLHAIASLKATVSGGPNITYELCARAASETLPLDFDLSAWRVAFNGAEPVRASSLERFARAFAPNGFKPSSFRPCYGLAEATLLVACQKPSALPHVFAAEQGVRHVSMGQPIPEASVRIVDSATGRPLSPGKTGEIWVAGPCVTAGYWNGNDAELFGALPEANSQLYLRTGDLGFLAEEELYVTGRIKDLIVIHGRNHHPEDIEGAISGCHPSLKPDSAVAFAVTRGESEALMVVQEIPSGVKSEQLDAITGAIRHRLIEDFGLVADTVAYARANRIPRTSSGKKRRHACRDLYFAGKLGLLKEDNAHALDSSVRGEKAATGLIERFCAQRLGLSPAEVSSEASLAQLGLDSLAAMELRSLLDQELGLELPLDRIADTPICRLAEHTRAFTRVRVDAPAGKRGTLSVGQKALWFLERVNPQSDAYTIARLLRIEGPLDELALIASFRELGRRHEILRGTIDDRGGEPILRFHQELDIGVIDLTAAPQGQLDAIVEQSTKPHAGPLFVVRLFRHSATAYTLLLTAHHIAVDLHSLLVLLEEVVSVYAARKGQASCELTESRQFSEFVAAEASLLAGPAAERLRRYWKTTLAGGLEPLRLSTAPDRRTGANGVKRFSLQSETFDRVTELARQWSLTPHTLMLAVYGVLLHRYSNQRHFPIGIVVSGRRENRFAEVVGYFANLLPIAVALPESANFRSIAESVSRAVIGALEHQDMPYSQIVDMVRVASQQQPLITAVCMWQSVRSSGHEVAGFISGEAGSIWQCEELTIRALPCEPKQAQFDLALTCVESPHGLDCAFGYDRGCFSSEMIDGLTENLIALTELCVEQPHRLLLSLPTPVSELVHEGAKRENDSARAHSGGLVHWQIQRAASSLPSRVAVSHRSSSITYVELQRKADQVAHYLRSLGIGTDSRVGIMAERSIPMVIGILGILNAGAAYVPLDPASPANRLQMILSEAGAAMVLVSENYSAIWKSTPGVAVGILDGEAIRASSTSPSDDGAVPGSLAYIMFTSGSTGKPKGVMVEHRNVTNFFVGMDEKVGCQPSDRLLAVTSIGFDISVLELLWTLARGAEVVLADEVFPPTARLRRGKSAVPEISLFYFADSAAQEAQERYQLLIEGAKLADAQGFSAIWTPERHFHSFGGLYPNPAITGAALSTITRRIHIRGGSVVMPLHNPIRVAEDWAMVDNLSRGRAGIAVASGWHADDFILNPTHYEDRKQITLRGIDTVRRLWRGETIRATGGTGSLASVGIYPLPVQREIPVWLTSSGNRETFVTAAAIEAHLLTHLLGQHLPALREKIETYLSLRTASSNPVVTLMLHTYIGESWDKSRDATLKPFKEYLKSSVDLMGTFVQSAGLDLDIGAMSEKDRDDLALFAAEKYMQEGGLFGSPEQCRERLVFLAEMGVTEVACLIDFGIERDLVLKGLYRVADAMRRLSAESPTCSQRDGHPERGVTMLQCTPTLISSMLSDAAFRQVLGGLRVLLLGGEPVPVSVAEQARHCGVPHIMNMYGPTETTIWSTASEIDPGAKKSFIRGPIVNTRIYIVNESTQAVPIGVVGEIAISGAGVARGYVGDPAQTAQRFVPDPFAAEAGSRLYRTGDLGRRDASGAIEILGRSDQQVKIRGYRIELGEIESALTEVPGIETAVVVPDQSAADGLAAYVVARKPGSLSAPEIERALRGRLPAYMVPREIRFLEQFPVNSNGKVDRTALSRASITEQARTYVRADGPPLVGAARPTGMEEIVTAIWRDTLKRGDFSVDSNFFDVGGHSLLMAQVHQRLQEAVGREFPLGSLLEAPTVRAMTRMLEAEGDEAYISTAEQASHQRGALRALWQHAGAGRQTQ